MNIVEQHLDVDASLFRRVMGRFATGVTVITAEVGGGVRGMTANAFMSGSLSPPLCIISVAKKARLHQALVRARHFGVSILAQGQRAISSHFAGQSIDRLSPGFEHLAGVPLLKSASAVIAAKIEGSHSCGDHTLFVGRIVEMRDNDRPPLVYHSGQYGSFVPSAGRPGESTIEFW
jgi:flavin reductase (DIM6/NTAB) family NADH-FMN oxidoreductase RutF